MFIFSPRQEDGLERVGQVVDVEDGNAVQVGDLVEVEVVGDDFGVEVLSQLDQLEINFADGGVVVLDDLNGKLRIALHALEDIEPAAASLAAGGILGVGDHLQLAKDELGDDERAFEKTGLGHIGNAAVDDGAGVQDLDIAPGGTAF